MSDAIKLTPIDSLDLDTRISVLFSGWIAYDKNSKAYLGRSSGQRKYGKPTRYFARCGDILVRFIARADDEAIQKANDKLNKRCRDA